MFHNLFKHQFYDRYMSSIFDKLVILPYLSPLAYWILLIVTILEVSPIFGLIIPGQTIVMLGGFLVKLGALDFFDVAWVCALGAVIGDLLSYYLGKKYGYYLIKKYGKYVLLESKNFKRLTEMVNEHTGKSLIIGRFVGITRSFAPFIAGASHIKLLKVLFCFLIGDTVWSFSFVSLGYLVGRSFEIASKYFERFALLAFILLILAIYIYRSIKKTKKQARL